MREASSSLYSGSGSKASRDDRIKALKDLDREIADYQDPADKVKKQLVAALKNTQNFRYYLVGDIPSKA